MPGLTADPATQGLPKTKKLQSQHFKLRQHRDFVCAQGIEQTVNLRRGVQGIKRLGPPHHGVADLAGFRAGHHTRTLAQPHWRQTSRPRPQSRRENRPTLQRQLGNLRLQGRGTVIRLYAQRCLALRREPHPQRPEIMFTGAPGEGHQRRVGTLNDVDSIREHADHRPFARFRRANRGRRTMGIGPFEYLHERRVRPARKVFECIEHQPIGVLSSRPVEIQTFVRATHTDHLLVTPGFLRQAQRHPFRVQFPPFTTEGVVHQFLGHTGGQIGKVFHQHRDPRMARSFATLVNPPKQTGACGFSLCGDDPRQFPRLHCRIRGRRTEQVFSLVLRKT